MERKETIRYAVGGAQLIEIRHQFGRAHTVSRYAVVSEGGNLRRDFATLRKARAALLAGMDHTPPGAADRGGRA